MTIMSNNINSIKKECTGCGSCFQSCKYGAIEMQEDTYGFLYPYVNSTKCINCGQCIKNCPIININFSNEQSPQCYAVMANDSIRINSSSGGVFTVLANYFLNNKGYVAGAVWNKDYTVSHIVSNKLEDIERMKGSKYLSSEIGTLYKEIENILNKQFPVLFTGTPCQVAGLKSYLKNDYKNLYCVDILCHGTPSPLVFKKYIKEDILNKKDEIWLNTNFRDKKNGWHPYLTTTTTTQAASDDNFMKAFLNNLCLRESCGDCKYSTIPRMGDITIGDFWGIDNCNPEYNDKKGTSVVFTNNLKALNLIKKVQNKFKLFEPVNLKYAIDGNLTLKHSSIHHHNRNYFFNNLTNTSLRNLNDFCIEDKCDYVIVNFWYSINYGAILTAYALQEYIKSLGLTCKVLNRAINAPYAALYKGSFTEDFANKYLNLTQIYDNNSLQKLSENIKGIILGSDQVLRLNGILHDIDRFLLNWANIKNRKIALSASFAIDQKEYEQYEHFTKKIKRKMMRALQSFDFLSCREIQGKDIFKNVFHIDSAQILDPVFLINKEKYNEIAELSNIDNSNKIISYILDEKDEYEKLYNYLSKQKNSEVIKIDNKNYLVEDWLKSIKEAKFVITDSFHGVCFALIFNKQFICIKNTYRGNARFDSLIELFNIANSFIYSVDEIYDKDLKSIINYDNFNQLLQQKKISDLEILNKVFIEGFSNNLNAGENKKKNIRYQRKKERKKKLNKRIKGFFQPVFSIDNIDYHKVIKIFGIKISIKRY